MGSKICRVCKKEKAVELFSNSKWEKDGKKRSCKACDKIIRDSKRGEINRQKREHYRKNRERLLSNVKEYYKNNKEKVLSYQENYYRENSDKVKQRTKKYKKKNKDSYYAREAKRRAMKVKATPKWFDELDDLLVKEAFSLARQRVKETGIDWHVDHLVPLKSKKVCGLHCADNIQVIPALFNLKKNNKWPHNFYFGVQGINSLRANNGNK